MNQKPAPIPHAPCLPSCLSASSYITGDRRIIQISPLKKYIRVRQNLSVGVQFVGLLLDDGCVCLRLFQKILVSMCNVIAFGELEIKIK